PARLDEVVRRLDLTDVLDRQAGTLPYGVQRRLEIARALSLVPDFVLLDEPVAGMNEVESTEIADVVRLLAGELGCGVLVVDHDLPFILGLCERIHVMDSGRCIATGTPAEVRANAEVVTAYLGVS
ncbi:MAG TPA: ATP-binding cassette domain-containing protein, partial [Ornithinicoccus sp.]|nr:ATP-binding cassette domain-containing protein [Ornithinicoccus sp.]